MRTSHFGEPGHSRKQPPLHLLGLGGGGSRCGVQIACSLLLTSWERWTVSPQGLPLQTRPDFSSSSHEMKRASVPKSLSGLRADVCMVVCAQASASAKPPLSSLSPRSSPHGVSPYPPRRVLPSACTRPPFMLFSLCPCSHQEQLSLSIYCIGLCILFKLLRLPCPAPRISSRDSLLVPPMVSYSPGWSHWFSSPGPHALCSTDLCHQ